MKKGMIALAAVFCFMFSGCAKQETPPVADKKEKPVVQAAFLKGPTSIGGAKLMADAEEGKAPGDYRFMIAGMPDEVVAKMVSGELDIAAVPTNLAATLYQKTEGEVEIAAVNTLGVLYILENGQEIQSIQDLQGKTIYATGQGATPEYALDFILQQNGLTDVTVEFLAEHSELAAKLAVGEVKIGLLPEPNVTAALAKNEDLRIALDLTKEWEAAAQKAGGEGSKLTMGCIAVRREFAQKNPEALSKFLAAYKESISYANENPKETADLVENFGILPSAQLAEQAIPNCNITYLDGDAMKEAVQGFLEILYQANPKSVGGKLPGDDFYYAA